MGNNTQELIDLQDFESKIDWEGGIYSALEYGLRASDYPNLPPRVREAWNDLCSAFDEVSDLVDEYRLAVHHASE